MPTDREYQQIKQWYNEQFAGNVHEWFVADTPDNMKDIVTRKIRHALNGLTDGIPAMDEATEKKFNGIIDSAARKFMADYTSEQRAGRNPDFTRTDSSFFQMFSSTLQNMLHEVAKLFRSSNPSVADLVESAAKMVIAEAKKEAMPRDIGVRAEGITMDKPVLGARESSITEEDRGRSASSVSVEDEAVVRLREVTAQMEAARAAERVEAGVRLGKIFAGEGSEVPGLTLPAALPIGKKKAPRSPQPPRGGSPLGEVPPSLAESLRRSSSADVAPSGLGTISAPPLHLPDNLPLPGIATDVKFTGGRGKGGR